MTNFLIDETLPVTEVEAAFDSVVLKLGGFYERLSADEKTAFMELLESAKAHTSAIQARNEGDKDKLKYVKPVQIHTTSAMKQMMTELPEIFSKL